MADDKSKRGSQDRRKVSGSEPYEVKYLAEKLGVTQESAEESHS